MYLTRRMGMGDGVSMKYASVSISISPDSSTKAGLTWSVLKFDGVILFSLLFLRVLSGLYLALP